eukprot:456345-Pelagomonas_calceolata.AAC.3
MSAWHGCMQRQSDSELSARAIKPHVRSCLLYASILAMSDWKEESPHHTCLQGQLCRNSAELEPCHGSPPPALCGAAPCGFLACCVDYFVAKCELLYAKGLELGYRNRGLQSKRLTASLMVCAAAGEGPGRREPVH